MAVSEIFLNAEDTYIAVTTQDPYMGGHHPGWDDPYYRQPFGYKAPPMTRGYPHFSGRDRK